MRVSPLGLSGSFGIGAGDVERAFEEHGINYFFVTPRMKGMVEGLKRLIRSGHRSRIVLASGAAIPTGGSVSREWEKTARVLGVDRIDVFHLFWVQAHWYVTGKTWPAMQRLKEEKRVGALSISIHDRKMARRLIDELDLDVLMMRYNAAHRGAEQEIFSTLGNGRPGIVSYTATRWRKLLKPVNGLGPMTSPECYRFVLGHPKVDVVLCGARNYEELREDVEGVLAGPLAPDRLDEIRLFGDAVRSSTSSRFSFFGR